METEPYRKMTGPVSRECPRPGSLTSINVGGLELAAICVVAGAFGTALLVKEGAKYLGRKLHLYNPNNN